ncbi:hypothetical protein OXYTRIMIC_066 [Oxytricha trifallax]|uniref:Uncharacterized protein n=1 Tax=Oxytricha trifallax TaxID=1172189 RepID=A0A073HZY3_9SPIT|nr:hypothetical protein OXYTRIMIC_066 [Oxytricha trifallax]
MDHQSQETLDFLQKLDEFLSGLPNLHFNQVVKTLSKEFCTLESACNYLANLIVLLKKHSKFTEVCNLLIEVQQHLKAKAKEVPQRDPDERRFSLEQKSSVQHANNVQNAFNQPHIQENLQKNSKQYEGNCNEKTQR